MPPELVVVNKIDAAGDLALARLRHVMPDAVFVSAHTGAGIERLRGVIADGLPRTVTEVELLLPYTEGALAARVHEHGEVLEERHLAEGTHMHARVAADLAAQLRRFEVPAQTRTVDEPVLGSRLAR
jgi:GTP-binding protein HflX